MGLLFDWSTWGLTPAQYKAKLKRERLLREAYAAEQARHQQKMYAQELKHRRQLARQECHARKLAMRAQAKEQKALAKEQRKLFKQARKAGLVDPGQQCFVDPSAGQRVMLRIDVVGQTVEFDPVEAVSEVVGFVGGALVAVGAWLSGGIEQKR